MIPTAYIEITLEQTATEYSVPATLHYHQDKKVFLKIVDLSKMLEDCWNAAVYSAKEHSMIVGTKWDENVIQFSQYDITEDGDKYLQSVLSPQK